VECVGHAAVAAQIQGNSLKLIYPKEGVMLIPRPIIITKSAKDKEVAKQFVNYAMSKSGQELVAKALLYPSLKGVNAIASMPKLGTFPTMTVHWDKIARTRTAVLARFRKDILDQ
jgi:iron(III) transport system substrate-binding protein